MNKIFEEIRNERERQDEKWGVQSHQPIVWTTILQEEVGEVAKAALEELFDADTVDTSEYREELIQCAAVCVAAIQCLDEGYADSHSKELSITVNTWSSGDRYPEPETGNDYIVIASDGNEYKGQFMDWGFVELGEEEALEDKGLEILFWKLAE